MTWTTNKAAFLVRSTHFGSSMVMVVISSMNPSIESSFASMSTVSWSAWTNGYCPRWHYNSSSSFLWGDCSSVAYHDLSLRISLPRSISDFLTVVYSDGVGVVPKGKWRHRSERFSTMAMHVDAIRTFA